MEEVILSSLPGLYLKKDLNSWRPESKDESLGKSFYSLSFNFQKVLNFTQSITPQSNKQSKLFIYYNIPKFGILGCYKERPRGLLFNRRDARDEEPLREPARLLGRVWKDKRYSGGMGGSATFARKRWHASKEI